MQTLTYGFLLPQTGDKGTPLWTALQANIQKTNDHNHDGINSAPISATAIASQQQAISHTNWTAYGGPIGHYRQLVTMAAGFKFDLNNISFRTAAGAYVYPTVERVNPTSFYIYTIDPTMDLVANYGG